MRSPRNAIRLIQTTWGLLATLVLALAVLPGSAATLGSASGGQSGITVAAPREPSEGIIVYVRPPERPIEDGFVSVRTVKVKPTASVIDDQSIGRFTGVRQLTHDASEAFVQLQDATGQIVYMDAAKGEVSYVRGDRRASAPAATIGSDKVLYQTGIDETVVGYKANGRSLGAQALPAPLPMTGPLLKDGKPVKIRLVNGGRRTGPLLSGPGGSVFAFVSNPENTVFANSASGARLDLIGYGSVYSAVIGGDGYVYALVHDGRQSTNTFVVVQIDPVAMTSKFTFATDVTPSGGSFTDLTLIASGDGAVVYGARLNIGGIGQASILLRLDRNAGRMVAVALADNLGSRAAMGPDGYLYLFSGPAGGSVSRVDLSSGQASSVPWLDAPAGTFIQALFLR